MLKIILVGCGGKMGIVVTQRVSEQNGAEIVAGVDKFCSAEKPYPVYTSISEVAVPADVIIYFSHPDILSEVVEFSANKNIPLVECTTGLSDEQTELIKSASKKVAIFSSFNMSLGVNLITELAKTAASILGDFDIEIIEQHHNQKIDAPSGTAYMLANAINETLNGEMQFNYDRHSTRAKRSKKEIGIHSIRGGNIVGEHEVIFAGTDEIIKISHSARSKEVFATGAVNAAAFIKGKPAGLYDMQDIIKG